MGSAFAPDSKEAVQKTAFERGAKDFKVWASSKSLGFDLPQRIGRVLWFPMLAMALMSFVVAWIFGVIRADEIAGGGNPDTIAAQGHLVPAFMFLGFASVFAAISFACAEAIRRLGIVMYLTSIAFGLATIIQILRFQSVRVRELPSEGAPDTSAA